MPRITIVRNPYARLLSAYLDKVVEHGRERESRHLFHHLHPDLGALNGSTLNFVQWARKNPVAGFDVFVRVLANYSDRLSAKGTAPPLNAHFRQQTSCNAGETSCHLSGGYAHVLRIEEEHKWFLPLIRSLSMEPAMTSGWKVTSSYYKPQRPQQDCFYAPDGCSCSDFHNLPTNGTCVTETSTPATAATLMASSPTVNLTRHAILKWSKTTTNSDSKLQQYFYPALADIVSEWARQDLLQLGYPRWDGQSAYTFSR